MAKVGFNGQWVEIAKVGKVADSLGVDRDLTPGWIQSVIANYAAGPHEAPLVLGHPDSDSAPAHGWVQEIRLNGDVLEARFTDTNDEFEKAVERGEYKKRSASFYLNPPNLRHVGFLGAQPPAIKGLRDIQFAEGDSFAVETFNLQETTMKTEDLDQMPDGFWEKFKAKLGIGEKADLSEGQPSNLAQFSEANVREIVKEATEAVKAEFAEQITTLKAENDDLKSKVDGQIAGGVKAEIASFVEQIPAEKGKHYLKRAGIAEFMESLAAADAADGETNAISFSEGDEKVEFSRVGWFKQLVNELPDMIQFGEKFGNLVATKGTDPLVNSERVAGMKDAAGVPADGGAK